MGFCFWQVCLDLFKAGQVLDICNCRGYFFRSSGAVGMLSIHIHVNKCAQAVVFAEVAARVFIACGAVANCADGLEANKCSLLAVLPKAECLLCRADGARFAAVFVDNDLRLFAVGTKAGLDEVYFSLHDGHVVLRSTLQYKARAERSEIRNARNVEKNIFRQYIGESRKNLF